MEDTSKYLIHAAITADGIVERSDVVGAIFGQTEGLLGEELDLRELQQSSKVGRIDVEIESEAGQSFGHVTIATSLDRVETSILAASLETITRVGPCQADVSVTDIEDVREAKRREVVERAKELLAESFSESIMTSSEILDEVRESVRVGEITEYEGLPAGPHVADSDAIVVVEGRADVLTLLKYGIKNAIAVEGTNVPDVVADLTQHRTVTAFLDGDRGGELILRELVQVGNVDYVAFAPDSQSVEDLSRSAVMSALRDKEPYETFASADKPDADAAETAESAKSPDVTDVSDTTISSDAANTAETSHTEQGTTLGGADVDGQRESANATTEGDEQSSDTAPSTVAETDGAGTGTVVATPPTADRTEVGESVSSTSGDTAVGGEPVGDEDDADAAETAPDESTEDETVDTLRGVARDVVEAESGSVRLTDEEFRTLASSDAADAFSLLKDADEVPYALFVDGEVTQELLDVAAQRGTEHVIGRSLGEFVKRPVSVRIRTAEQLLGPRAANE